jgi:hypothetical protein
VLGGGTESFSLGVHAWASTTGTSGYLPSTNFNLSTGTKVTTPVAADAQLQVIGFGIMPVLYSRTGFHGSVTPSLVFASGDLVGKGFGLLASVGKEWRGAASRWGLGLAAQGLLAKVSETRSDFGDMKLTGLALSLTVSRR